MDGTTLYTNFLLWQPRGFCAQKLGEEALSQIQRKTRRVDGDGRTLFSLLKVCVPLPVPGAGRMFL